MRLDFVSRDRKWRYSLGIIIQRMDKWLRTAAIRVMRVLRRKWKFKGRDLLAWPHGNTELRGATSNGTLRVSVTQRPCRCRTSRIQYPMDLQITRTQSYMSLKTLQTKSIQRQSRIQDSTNLGPCKSADTVRNIQEFYEFRVLTNLGLRELRDPTDLGLYALRGYENFRISQIWDSTNLGHTRIQGF